MRANKMSLLVLAYLLAAFVGHADAQTVYIADSEAGKIQKANLDGPGPTDVVTKIADYPTDIALDLENRKMYWIDEDAHKIQCAILDGTEAQGVLSFSYPLGYPWSIAVDPDREKLYWTEVWPTPQIRRANLDGTEIETLVTAGAYGWSWPFDIALDVAAGKIYWSDEFPGAIWCADPDGHNATQCVSADCPTSLAFDPIDQTLYWIESCTGRLYRVNTATGSRQLIAQEVGRGSGLAIDFFAREVYWYSVIEEWNPHTYALSIRRADIDGMSSEPETVIELSDEELTPWSSVDIAVDGSSGKVYWYNAMRDAVFSADRDGSNIQPGAVGFRPSSLTLVSEESRLYWSSWRSIQRADLVDWAVEDVIAPLLVEPKGIAADPAQGKIYWSDRRPPGVGKIQRANMDGTDVQDVFGPVAGRPEALSIDSAAGKLYWTDLFSRKIRRSNLDGSNAEDVVTTGLRNPSGIAVDGGTGKVYWTDVSADKIQRANLDGSHVEDLVTTGLFFPKRLALDAKTGKMYWSDTFADRIWRADVDGSNMKLLLTEAEGLIAPQGIALDDANELYWVHQGVASVQRMDLSAFGVEDLVSNVLHMPYDVVIDPVGGKVYWTDVFTDSIQGAGLDGSNPQELVTEELIDPRGLAIDVAAEKIYWTDFGTRKIQRADLDGANVQDLVTTELMTPRGIDLDVKEGRMYWGDDGTGKIKRANLDGSAVEDLCRIGPASPKDITVDSTGGTVYWTDIDLFTGEAQIGLSNYDCFPVTLFPVSGSTSWGIALDPHRGHIFWSDYAARSVYRANLDTFDTKEVVTELASPVGIALDARGLGDFDMDWDVDLRDYARFQTCFSGHHPVSDAACVFFDADGDGDADLPDYATFVETMATRPR